MQKSISNYTIDANNDTLAFKYDGKDVTIKIPQKTYSDGNDLANAVQNALDTYTDYLPYSINNPFSLLHFLINEGAYDTVVVFFRLHLIVH